MFLNRTAATLATVAVTAVTMVTMAAPASAETCHYKVTWASAGVYEDPSNLYKVKTKYAGDIVGPYCNYWYNSHEGNSYRMVATDAAADGYGWMRTDALVRVS